MYTRILHVHTIEMNLHVHVHVHASATTRRLLWDMKLLLPFLKLGRTKLTNKHVSKMRPSYAGATEEYARFTVWRIYMYFAIGKIIMGSNFSHNYMYSSQLHAHSEQHIKN